MATPKQKAFAFDIDGVLLRGRQALPQGIRTIQRLHKEKVPFIFLTNGGGCNESAKAAQLSEKLQTPVSADQVVLCHSPLRQYVSEYQDKRILVLGGFRRNCVNIAREMGFNKASAPIDLLRSFKTSTDAMWPFLNYKYEDYRDAELLDNVMDEQFHAVFLWHDSYDWGLEAQVAIDLLRAEGGRLSGVQTNHQTMPLYTTNSDLLWANDFTLPRFGQGVFPVAMNSLFHSLTGSNLKRVEYGKPNRGTYEYAEKLIKQQTGLAAGELEVYAIGDNPEADIAGANAYGWNSVLVRTGVFRGPGDNDKRHPAKHVFDHVEAAVDTILN
ncbi:HAD-superfamily hydrolase [Ramicandelaber brevisporus]|nr:HAD-superfamily hydrolase [Ramicandelaber brevisporus]